MTDIEFMTGGRDVVVARASEIRKLEGQGVAPKDLIAELAEYVRLAREHGLYGQTGILGGIVLDVSKEYDWRSVRPIAEAILQALGKEVE